ncbi:MAG: rRNA maturation RNase YbeY [Candidatus Dadabacteria bacterium]|nr:MAG: rRNA maturation RNase YbeY [Candidatus Dadabacteria bacterium]
MNRVEVTVDSEDRLSDAALRAVRAICRFVLDAEQQDRQLLTVLIATPPTSSHLNQTWRQRDYVANVLSFPGSGAPLTPRSRLCHLGDIAVCPAVAAQEAAGTDVTPQLRLAHLLVHGVLHLLGYDHIDDPVEARRMEQRERELLAALPRPEIQRLLPLFAVGTAGGPSVT